MAKDLYDASDAGRRHDAETRAGAQIGEMSAQEPAAIGTRSREALLHELQVHQIELEMQNDELRCGQQILEESRNRYQELYDFAPIGYLTLDGYSAITEANLTAAELFGMTRKDLLQQRFSHLVGSEDREQWLREFTQTMKQGDPRSFDVSCLRADGSRFYGRLACLRMEPGGEATQMRIVLSDITEQWLARQHLAELIATSMDAMISVDSAECVQFFNPAAEQMFGMAADLALGQPLGKLLPEAICHLREIHRQAHSQPGITHRHLDEAAGLQGRRANGELFPLVARVSLAAGQGHCLFTMVLREISERRRVEQALRDTQADLNRAQAVGQLGSWRFTAMNNELVWSDENHRIFGLAKGTPLSYDTFLSVVHPDDREYVDRMWQAALHGAAYDIDHRLLVDGVVKWVREIAEIEFDAHGQILGGFGTTQDITELKQAEQALLDAHRRKDEFLAMLGHELRNPLTPIRNAAHVLGRLPSREPHVQWARDIIEQQVVHLTRLVDDLLDVSRIVRGKIELRQESVALASVVAHAMDMAQPLLDAKNHHLELHLPEMPVWLRGDPVRLAQILLNLLDNAAKYTPEGGRIELSATVSGASIEIRLRDNGIGIPADLLPRVFDLFQQNERTLDRAQGGLGLGLTLVKRLVELHGGAITVTSAGAGQGSEFTLRLPAQVAAAPAVDHQRQAPPVSPGCCRVLVVDDDPAVAESLCTMLEIEGHGVKSADNGAAALHLAQEFHPHLVLLDIGLQGMDGYQVARLLRSQENPAEPYFLVAVTGYGQEMDRNHSRLAGFDQHLVKPVFPETLCELAAEVGRGHPPEPNFLPADPPTPGPLQ